MQLSQQHWPIRLSVIDLRVASDPLSAVNVYGARDWAPPIVPFRAHLLLPLKTGRLICDPCPDLARVVQVCNPMGLPLSLTHSPFASGDLSGRERALSLMSSPQSSHQLPSRRLAAASSSPETSAGPLWLAMTNKYLVRVLVVLLHACFSVVSPIPFLLAAIFFPGHPYIGSTTVLPDRGNSKITFKPLH